MYTYMYMYVHMYTYIHVASTPPEGLAAFEAGAAKSSGPTII